MKKRQYGCITIDRATLEDFFEEIKKAFREIDFFPLDTIQSFIDDTITYKGTSPKFKKVLKGCEIPNYLLFIEYQEKQFGDIRWIELKRIYVKTEI